MPLENNIREEVQYYLENADDRMLKIVHANLQTNTDGDFWDEVPSSLQQNIHTAINQSKHRLGKNHDGVMAKYKKQY